MTTRYNQNHPPLVKIVYTKVVENGRTNLIPFELYADGSLKRVA